MSGSLVFIGTKAQFVKMAPVLRAMDSLGHRYWLVYTGQHNETFDLLEKSFGTRPADEILVPAFEASTHLKFARWSASFWWQAIRRIPAWCRMGLSNVVVHGDTVSALFGALAGKLAGMRVAHIEAGLRSPRLLDPFPEEVIRRMVSRLTTLHFAPDCAAAANLAGFTGVQQTGGNTLLDALRMALTKLQPSKIAPRYVVVSLHRNENLSNAKVFDSLMQIVVRISERIPIKFVLHPATRERLKRTGWMAKLVSVAAIELVDRMDYPDFVQLLVGSRMLLTDGGSNQEEAAMMGLPTLLFRHATERPDGLGDTVILSGQDVAVIHTFVEENAEREWELRPLPEAQPSLVIARALDQAQVQANA